MKTFVSNTYQITTKENGGFECRITLDHSILITYEPVDKGFTWFKSDNIIGLTTSYNIFGLDLTKLELEVLCEALETVGKQDLASEIVFVEAQND